ncbi:hypothetical protein [Thermodesulfatator autotrophicus]|uniref:Lipoprotein n=1 Tax=Thermodesulfatator autotrophicus TaxID=1795632 RepID=A0A177EAA3_9BACT|nr:hypothetical protein [Thermodesulfatator autotrophicus]OAG28451.1 hypothetical protein TH606_01745 [Thermodesulfatator autotrophicus]
MLRKGLFLGLLGLFLLSACGGPEYIIKNHYILPADTSSSPCIKDCQEKFENCQKACEAQYHACLSDVRQKATSLYEKELKKYREELNIYQDETNLFQQKLALYLEKLKELSDDYHFFEKICQEKQDKYACSRQEELKKKISRLKQEKPSHPLKPVEPDLEDIIKKLTATCSRDCGCQKIYDHCFISCGGTIIPEKFCVENCQ